MNYKTIALIGQPNAGKSTLFNVLSDIKTSTSNFPGTTVAYKETFVNVFGETYRLVDLPGTYSLNPTDKAEEVTLKYILDGKIDLIINVVDSTLLSRSIELTIELMELSIPMVLALNMQDEAKRYGVNIFNDKLKSFLNLPVISTTGLYGKGVKELIETCDSILRYTSAVKELKFSSKVENLVNKIEIKLDDLNIDYSNKRRFYAIKTIENPNLLPTELNNKISDNCKELIVEKSSDFKYDLFETFAAERHHLAMKITHEVSELKPKKVQPFSEKFDSYLLHPIGGYFFMGLFFFFYFFTIFQVGLFLSWIIEPALSVLPNLYAPLKLSQPFLWYTVDGLYQGFSGSLGIVLPYFLPLLFLTSIFEDTGYMARIAFLLDGVFHKIGLHGKSVAPFIMGFGCTVPAIYATRIIENQRDRLITGILINFIPCSARITVIFALAAAFTGPLWALVVFLFVLFIIAVNGKILSIFLNKPTGLVLEIPNLKMPSLAVTFKKTWYKIREFFKVALPFLILGSIVLGWLEYFHIAQYINFVFSPVIKSVLGLPEQLGSTLVFGFLRKELIIVMATQALNVNSLSQLPMTVHQVIVFIVFVVLYFPCISTFAVFWKEFGAKTVTLTAVFSVFIATISAFVFRIILNL